jgi:predicted phage tail protein
MNDVDRLTEVIEGYAVLAGVLLKKWSPFLTVVSAKAAAGSYQATDAKSDFPTAAKLVAETMMAFGSEAVDALSIATSSFSEQMSTSEYTSNPAHAGTTRTVLVKADLVSATGKTLPKARVKPVPDTLAPTLTTFALDVDCDGMKARTYDGVIVVTDVAGDVEEILVSVTVG